MNLFMDVFLNICTLLSGYLALWKLLDKREMPNRFLWNCAKWGYVLLAAFLQALVSQLHIPWLNLVTIAISFVGMTKLFFRCNLVPLLLYDTAVMVCLFAADMVSSLAVSVSLGDSVSETLQRTDVLLARYLLCIILCFMLCSIFPLFFKRRELYEIYWYEVIAYGLLAAFEITSAAYIVHRLQFFSSGLFVILFTMGCLVLDIYLVFVFYQLAESRKREKEYSLIQQQSNIQLSVYRELSQKYADSVRIAHDAKKHVRALEDLVQSEQASQYRDSICAELNKLYPAFEHENPLFSVLINHALYRSERNGIRLDLRLHDADLSMLSDMDLTILFATCWTTPLRLAHHCRRKSERSSSSWNRKWAFSSSISPTPLRSLHRCRTISMALPSPVIWAWDFRMCSRRWKSITAFSRWIRMLRCLPLRLPFRWHKNERTISQR